MPVSAREDCKISYQVSGAGVIQPMLRHSRGWPGIWRSIQR